MSFFYSYFFHMRQDKSLFRLGTLELEKGLNSKYIRKRLLFLIKLNFE